MLRYTVYLEARPGACLAHVAELPGCVLRAADRSAALDGLPAAVRRHHAWLRRHGEPAPQDDEPDLELVGEFSGAGPFNPGDTAAFLPSDALPVSEAQMEECFRLMDHARADLLALLGHGPQARGGGLAASVLDWQPAADADAWSIRRVLRHVGNAEEWYVSRLVAPETLPAEWQHDEDLPLPEFLQMERRTALARLRALTPEERSACFYPTAWTDHPDEPWTLAKVLRRCLEHELEHTAQVRDILDLRRDCLHGFSFGDSLTQEHGSLG